MFQKTAAALLAAALLSAALAGCQNTPPAETAAASSSEDMNADDPEAETGAASSVSEEAAVSSASEESVVSDSDDEDGTVPEEEGTPLVIGCTGPAVTPGPFLPAGTAGKEWQDLTALRLLRFDRDGQVLFAGIEGEERKHGNRQYMYYAPADLSVMENGDGTGFYDIHLRDDLVFSDGTPLTADDVIFTMYVLCDPCYEGDSLLGEQPIEGLEEYRKNYRSLFSLIPLAGRSNTDYSLWTEEQQKDFWEAVDDGGAAFAEEIVDHLVAEGFNKEEDSIALCAKNWGYELDPNAKASDFFLTIGDACGWNIRKMNEESAGSMLEDLLPEKVLDYADVYIRIGDSAGSISGIQKLDDYDIRIMADRIDPLTLRQLAFPIAPLHYYGDREKYNYDLDSEAFGFTKGEPPLVQDADKAPLGAGPYVWQETKDGTVTYKANDLYYQGVPEIRTVCIRQTEDEDIPGQILDGVIDVAASEDTAEMEEAVRELNHGVLSGAEIRTLFTPDPGYGYIGIHAVNVSVGRNGPSPASRSLRKAFAVLFAAGRKNAADAWFGERAEVIEYPVLNTAWAMPSPDEEEYRESFTRDPEGKEIFEPEMTEEERWEAASKAALAYLQAAGYTISEDKAVRAPWAAALEYEILAVGGGKEEHPAFSLLKDVQTALEKIGITLTITDLETPEALWARLEEGTAAMWCAAWSADPGLDMYQIYSSGQPGTAGEQRELPAYYQITDPELEEKIRTAAGTTDPETRKEAYRRVTEILDDWAVEIPFYQKRSAVLFSERRIDTDSLPEDLTASWSWTEEIYRIKQQPADSGNE